MSSDREGNASPFATHPADELPQPSGDFDDGGNPLTDGWGSGGSLDLDALGANVRAAIAASKGPIFKAWLGLAGVIFVLYVIEMGFDLLGIYAFGPLGWVGSLVGIVASLVGVLVGAALMAMYRPLRRRVHHPDEPAVGPREVIDEIKPVYVQVLLANVIVGALTALGSACLLIPGLLAAFFLAMAPYLAATRELPAMEALHTSFNLAKRHWQTLLVGIAGGFVIIGVAVGVTIGLAFVGNETVLALLGPVQWIVMAAFYFALFVFWGGVFLTIDARDRDEPAAGPLPV